MFSYSKMELSSLAKELNFVRDTLEKVIRLSEMKEVVKDFLAKLLVITANEKKFLDLFKQKIYKPELLFDDAGILNRIKDHYMIAWKLQDHNK